LESFSKIPIDYEIFVEKQSIIKESNKLLNSYLNQLNQIKFTFNETSVQKDSVGELIKPISIIKSSIDLPINDAKEMLSLAYLKNKVVACDFNAASLHFLSLDTWSIDTFEDVLIKEPSGLCVGKNDELFIAECSINNVIVYDHKLNFLRQLNTQEKLREALKMKIDLIETKNLLYISHKNHDKITVWNSQRGNLVDTIKIKAPSCMEFSQDFLYVLSYTEWDRDEQTGKLVNLQKDTNCIFILDKFNYETVDKIMFDYWLQPFGLYLDKNINIITTAYELNENNEVSNDRFLYVISQTGDLLNKIMFEHTRGARDLIFFDDKMFRCYKKSIKMIEFE
jgi:hypothetical protein